MITLKAALLTTTRYGLQHNFGTDNAQVPAFSLLLTLQLLIGQGQVVPGDTATAFVADFLWSLGLEVHVPHHLSPHLRRSLETARVHQIVYE